MKLTFCTRKTSLVANPAIKKNVASRVQNRSGCTAQIVDKFTRTSAMVTRWSVHGKIPTQMYPSRNKQKDQCQTMGRLESRFDTTGHRVLNVCTRTKKTASTFQLMGQIQEGRVAAGEKSLGKAPPRMHRCQPCRQSRSRRVLFTVPDLTHVVDWLLLMRTKTCLGRLENQSELSRAVRGKGAASEPQCTTKLVSNVYRW